MTRGWTGLRTAVFALGLVAWTGTGASAAALINYSTSGQIESTGVSGPGVIGFNGVLNNSFNAPSALSLGQFQVAGLQAGQATTYNNTPFHISYLTNLVNGKTPTPNETPIVVNGTLSGTVNGSDQSNVQATFDTTTSPLFKTGLFANTLKISDSPLSLVPSTSGGLTSAQAKVESALINPASLGESAQGVPEPSSIAMFLVVVAGLGLHHRSRRTAC